ncbi:hypothetical protein APHAL10511_005187 [Amanita phalloides]|nr:hypothetical protein APHAL10511_005187 [Amanita phalloides]
MTDTPHGSLNVISSRVTDTPVKPSVIFPMTYGETAQQAASSVKRSLKGNVRIASSKGFCETFLPVPDDNDLDRALLQVKRELYDNDLSRWKCFPTGKNESEFYLPFQKIAEAVNKVSRGFAMENAIHTTWLDRHSKAPETKSKDAAAIRPDIVQVSASTRKDFDELDEQIQQSRTNKENELKIWWMHIHTVVEIKSTPQNSEKLHDTIIQLCSYIRQLFREQLDRRFAIALLLCGDELTLWYCDRVGLVGTIDPINIHANPHEFMKVLAAFSILPADKLGWDPTMKLYRGKGKDVSPSYLVSQAPNTGRHGLNWCISMPDMSGENNRSREDRASIVWEVVKKEDYENCNSDASVFVLKQAWQATLNDTNPIYDGVLEVKMHEIGGRYKDRYRSHETVRDGKGDAVSTDVFRSGLTVETFANAF